MCWRSYCLLILASIGLTNCNQWSVTDVFDPAMDPKVRQILEESLDRAGGISDWKSVVKLKFDKVTTLYDSTGQMETETEQQHRFYYQPHHIVEIIWQDEDGNHQLLTKDGKASKYINGQKLSGIDEKAALDRILSAEYAATLPFKLLDPHMDFTYEGIDTLFDELFVHVIRANYQPHQTRLSDSLDTWWHYFNVNNFQHEGYKVQHDDHSNLVINNEYIRTNDFVFPGKRSSYRLDDCGEQQFLRASYQYRNFKVKKDIHSD